MAHRETMLPDRLQRSAIIDTYPQWKRQPCAKGEICIFCNINIHSLIPDKCSSKYAAVSKPRAG